MPWGTISGPSRYVMTRGTCALAQIIFAIAVVLAAAPASDALAKVKGKYAALVIDHHTGKVLYSRNAGATRYPASLTKVMTLYLLFERLDSGQLTYDSRLNVSAYAAGKPPSKIGVKAGGSIRVKDAILALVTKSANDVAAVVAENLGGSEARFADMMTRKARELGMASTTFRNASGLPDAKQRTTARDLAILARRMITDHPKRYAHFKTRSFKYRGKSYRNHNRLLSSYRGTDGIKTGYIRASGFNLMSSVRRGNKHLVAIVMGGQTGKWRNSHMAYLLNKAMPKAIAMTAERRRRLTMRIPVPPRLRAVAGYQQPAPEPAVAAAQSVPSRALVSRETVLLPDAPSTPPLAHPSFRSTDFTAAIPGREQVAAERPSSQEIAQDVRVPAPTAALAAPEPTASGDIEPDGADEVSALDPRLKEGPYHIQIGAYRADKEAKTRLANVSALVPEVLQGRPQVTMPVRSQNSRLYRARFAGFSKVDARTACSQLRKLAISCIVTPAP